MSTTGQLAAGELGYAIGMSPGRHWAGVVPGVSMVLPSGLERAGSS
ncbi:hypothetical protein ACFWP5_50210 [Streptomyces sp. NPDC058469]